MTEKNKDVVHVDVDEISSMLKQVAPEMVTLLEDRYNILNVINFLQPIGRRTLSANLNITERIIRKEANMLKDQELVSFSLEGMSITPKGEETLEMLKLFFHDLKGLRNLESKLTKNLGINKVVIGSTISENRELALKEMGKTGAGILKDCVKNNTVLGITGGTSVHSIVEEFRYEPIPVKNVSVVPARGGLGKVSEYQANTLVEKLAKKIGCHYKLLFTPDALSKTAIDSLMNEPAISEMVEFIEKIDVLVFGIGHAETMAKRRSLTQTEIDYLMSQGAVSEGFGYYFNQSGEIVYEISSIGISLNKYKSLNNIIAIARGKEKAEAIISISKLNPNLTLILDEATALKINEILKEEM